MKQVTNYLVYDQNEQVTASADTVRELASKLGYASHSQLVTVLNRDGILPDGSMVVKVTFDDDDEFLDLVM